MADLLTERHAPKITTELCVHLADDIQEDTVVVLGDSAVCDKLRNNGTVAVNLILEEGIEVLVIAVIWHDDQEYEI